MEMGSGVGDDGALVWREERERIRMEWTRDDFGGVKWWLGSAQFFLPVF